ncbi:MAG: CidA/LrgA family protein [Pseudomonadota bacterium]
MVQGFLILLLCQLTGEWLMVWLGIPVPGPVAGMILLLIGLVLYGRVPEYLRMPAEGLIRHLSLLFVPAGVGLMVFADVLAQQWLAILLSLLLSTFITLIVTAWMLQTLETRQRK